MNTLQDIISFLAAVQEQAGETRSQLEEFRTQVEAAIAPGPEFSRMKSALQRMAAADSQGKILQTYLKEAVAMMDAGILFLRDGGNYVPWKASGFTVEDVQPISAQDEENPLILATAQRRVLVRLKNLDGMFPWLKSLEELPQAAVCIPLVFEDFVPAVTYLHTSASIPLDALELLTHLATLVCKNHALREAAAGNPEPVGLMSERPAEENAARVAFEPSPEEPVEDIVGTFTYENPEEAVEETSDEIAEEIVEPEKSLEDLEEEIDTEPAVGTALDQFGFQQSEEEEEAGDFSPAGASSGIEEVFPDEASLAIPRPDFEPPLEPVVDAGKQAAEPKDPHAEAKRVSRLLVSEIKLYNSQEVNAGRRDADLYARLKKQIDAGRAKYQEQVDASVAAAKDYYHEELVSILAMGDEKLMGLDYPGPDLQDG